MGQREAADTLEKQQLGRVGFSSTPQIQALLLEAVRHPQATQVRPESLQATLQGCVPDILLCRLA